MDDFDQFERKLAAALRSDADQSLAHFEPATVARAAMAGTQRGHAAPPMEHRQANVQPLGASLRLPSSACSCVGGAFLLIQRGQPSIGDPSQTPSAASSQPAEVVPSETPAPTPTSTAEATPPAVGQNLKLTWTKLSLAQRSPRIAWLVDRFVQVDDESRLVQTSTDGFSWHVLQPGDPDPGYLDLMREVRNAGLVTWGDDIVRWWNPEEGADIGGKPPITARDIVRIVRPGAAPTDTTPFKGRIGSLGIGPAGIVATVDSQLDFDAWVASKLGKDWVSHYTECGFQERDPARSSWTTAQASRSTGRTRASCPATTCTRASAGTARMACSGRRSRGMAPTSPSTRSSASRTVSSPKERPSRTDAPCRMAVARCGIHQTV